eukprot:scaffold482_cov247-Pinguiococcus_pyrenoidosus.AAC.26
MTDGSRNPADRQPKDGQMHSADDWNVEAGSWLLSHWASSPPGAPIFTGHKPLLARCSIRIRRRFLFRAKWSSQMHMWRNR